MEQTIVKAPGRNFRNIVCLWALWLALAPVAAFAATNILIPAGSVWKYLDDGSDRGSAWRVASYDDSAWGSGPAKLGYGETDLQTELRFFTNAANRPVTHYFRRLFSVSGSSNYTGVTLRLLRDDGAIVYLNGTNVFRSNMPGGAVNFRTLASSAVSGAAETNFVSTNLAASVLLNGENVIAVEVHQSATNSTDLSFDLQLLGVSAPPSTNTSISLIRGPYLQQGTTTNIIIRWRTDDPSDSRVRFGDQPGVYSRTVSDPASVTEHEVRLTGLTPDTKYYYSIGSSDLTLAGGDSCFFVTAPTNAKPTRIWVIGDSGTGDDRPRSVYQSYTNYAGSRYTDLWLMLGDNAYNTGTDPQYQTAVFEMYPEMLRQTVLWPTIGNHDTAFSANPAPTIPYFRNFTLPTGGEAGGVPSGTEKYYSFDYGNIHFICLDAMSSSRATDGPMCTWLQQDLAAHDKDWVIAFWHHPPYTKGSHNSDLEGDLIEMRQNVVPILESYDVDLVLCGHSHCYERSFLIHGHYGFSDTFSPEMQKDGGNGREDGDGAYRKPSTAPDTGQGTVYIVAGNAGQATFLQADAPHSAMFYTELELGSLVVDIDGSTLRAKFLRETGAIDDYFTLAKSGASEVLRMVSFERTGNNLLLGWTTTPGKNYRVESAASLAPANWASASAILSATGVTLSWTVPLNPHGPSTFFRVVRLAD